MRPLATVQRYIGFEWNLESHTVALPPEKLSKILSILGNWLVADRQFSAKEATSLHGKLVHISCIFPLICPFLRSISGFATSFTHPQSKLWVPPGVHADLSWVYFLIKRLPNETPLAPSTPVDIQWWGDASSSFGIGIALSHYWVVWKWAPGFKVGPHQDFDIGWAETVAIELGLWLALKLGLLDIANQPGHSFLVRLDNAGVVVVTNKGRSRSRETNKILKHIYLLQAEHQIRLKSVHVTSRENISDALSSGAINEFLKGFPVVNMQASISLLSHLSDKLISW
jgi:hypothetical protein